jgi:hypothetical protein
MAYVIYNRDTTRIAPRANGMQTFATEAAAKGHISRFLLSPIYAVAEYTYFKDNIEQQVERVNLMTGQTYMEPVNTPVYMSPASESFWSM